MALASSCDGGSLNGMAELDGCSGALIKFDTSRDDDPALLLTAAHCLHLFTTHEVLVDEPYVRNLVLLTDEGGSRWIAVRIEYATMDTTDFALLRLEASYRTLATQARVTPRVLARQGPRVGDVVRATTGLFRESFTCKVEALIPTLQEHEWTWNDSVRLGTECHGQPGMSGTPILDRAGEVVNLLNTACEGTGPACSLDNPCELDGSGLRRVVVGSLYSQQTAGLYPCLDDARKLDLSREGCALPKPAPE